MKDYTYNATLVRIIDGDSIELNVNQQMIADGHAVAYEGGGR